MSTRCQIGFYEDAGKLAEPEAIIYRHSDGYPEGVIPELKPLVESFIKARGEDIEYLAAYIVSKFKGDDMINIGICGDKELHGDIDYYYAVYPNYIAVYEGAEDFEDLVEKEMIPLDLE